MLVSSVCWSWSRVASRALLGALGLGLDLSYGDLDLGGASLGLKIMS